MIFLRSPAVILYRMTVTDIQKNISKKLAIGGPTSFSPPVENAGEHPSASSMRFQSFDPGHSS